jgi:hypothetical protein
MANFRSSTLAPGTLPEAASSTITTQYPVSAITLSAATTMHGRVGQAVRGRATGKEATLGREGKRKLRRKFSDQLSVQT